MKLYKISLTAILLCFLGLLHGNAQQIIKAEYFFSPDPGVGNGIDIPITPGDSIDISFTADFSSLEPGHYSVFVRLKDENGVWSQSINRHLLIEPPQVTEPVSLVEYYFDADPGAGNGLPINIASADSIDITSTISIIGLEPGYHFLYLRARDENGSWSSMASSMIYVEPTPQTGQIIAAEYFFDADPGIGNGFPLAISSSDTLDIVQSIPIPGTMDFGAYRLYVRVQSADSLWSQYGGHYFEVCDTYGPLAGYDYILSPDRWVAFDDQTENSTSWLWDFDDGYTDTVASPVHQYNSPGIYNVKQYAINDCGTDTLESEVVIRGIFSVESNKGSNNGSAMIDVSGFGFTSNAELSLTKDGFASILPDTFSIQNDQHINARFDLRDQEAGFWNVQVVLPGDTAFIYNDGFEILEGGAPDLQIIVNGRSRILINRDYTYNVTIKNKGYEDAVGIALVIRNIPSGSFLKIGELDTLNLWGDPFYNELTSYVVSNNINTSVIGFSIDDEFFETSGFAFVVPFIPANSSLTFSVKVYISNVSVVSPEFLIAPQGYLTSTSLLQNNPILEPINCRSGEFRSSLEMALDTIFDDTEWDNCFETANMNALDYLRNVSLDNVPGEQLIPYQGLNGVILYDIASCILGTSLDTATFISAMGLLNERFNTLDLVFEDPEDCDVLSFDNIYTYQGWNELINTQATSINEDLVNQIFNPMYSPKDDCVMCGVVHCMGCATMLAIDGVGSMDPNEKTGPGNNPYNNYLNGTLDLSYAIHFENIETASAPAAMVKIVDTLDPEKYDLTSFEFETFGYNTSFFSGTMEDYSMLAIYDLRPERPCYLKLQASIDTLTGYAEWIFESLDTITFQLTEDPDAGFLLPNVNHPEGEGFVSFTINLKDNLVAGNEIENQAEIIFDFNDPILTNVWTNVFDDIAPESQVLSLPDTIYYETFTLEWEGFDANSGVQYYDIYASTIESSDTTLAIWQYHTGETENDLFGDFGEKYYFYAIATDSAGNIEPGVTAYDAEVLLYNPCWDSVMVNQYYEICYGDSVLIEGNWCSESGIYMDTLSTIYGCDSIIQSELIVFPLPNSPEITWDGTTLMSTPAETYQWYMNGYIIANATEQTYIPAESGNYSVEVSDEYGCLAISDEIEVILTGIYESDHFTGIKLFPNPSKGLVNVQNSDNLKFELKLYSAQGELMFLKKIETKQEQLDLRFLQKGIYFIKIINPYQTKERKIIVN